MAYNLNYNPGVEYERHLRRRKILIISISVLVLLVLGILLYLGFRNKTSDLGENPSNFNEMTEEQKNALLQSMSSQGTTTIISTEEQSEIIEDMSANEGSEEVISGAEQEDLIKAMSAKQ